MSSRTPTLLPVDPALQRRLDTVVRRIDELTAERDQLVLQARDEGASLREIAAHAGMTHVGVKKLIGRHLHPVLLDAMDQELPDEDGPTE